MLILVVIVSLLVFQIIFVVFNKQKNEGRPLRINRVILILSILLGIISLIIIGVLLTSQDERDYDEMLIGLGSWGIVFAVLSAYFSLFYYKSFILLEDTKFIYKKLFNQSVTVYYEQINDIKINHFKMSLILYSHTKKPVKLSLYFSNLDVLLSIIEQRKQQDYSNLKTQLTKVFI